jgi:hypothetical protein
MKSMTRVAEGLKSIQYVIVLIIFLLSRNFFKRQLIFLLIIKIAFKSIKSINLIRANSCMI